MIENPPITRDHQREWLPQLQRSPVSEYCPPFLGVVSTVCLLVLQPFAPSCFQDFLTNTASADFFQSLIRKISPGKVLKLSARAAKLYLMRLSVTVGFRVP
jgi:hypothetical protein